MPAATLALADLPRWAFAFAIVLSRAGAAVMLLPGFGEVDIPPMLRAGFLVGLALLLVPLLEPAMPPMPDDIGSLLAMVAGELLVGAWIGWLARLVVLSAGMAGQVASYMLGLANVLRPDPAAGAQSTALEHLLVMAAILSVFATGLHAMPLLALAGSYALIPPGAMPSGADGTTTIVAATILAALADSFVLALRLAAPFLLAGIVWQVALGLLSRLVPRLQVYFVAMPGQIIGGLLLLGLVSAALIDTWQAAAQDAFARLPGLF